MSTHNSQTDLWQSSKVQKLQNRPQSRAQSLYNPKVHYSVDLLRIYSKTCTINTGYVYVYIIY